VLPRRRLQRDGGLGVPPAGCGPGPRAGRPGPRPGRDGDRGIRAGLLPRPVSLAADGHDDLGRDSFRVLPWTSAA